MSKRFIIAHGWSGSPDEPMLKWIGETIQTKGFEVIAPHMPHPETPTIEDWVPALSMATGVSDVETYFIGHSVGCQTTLRYLETLPENIKIGGVVLIAPWFLLTMENLDDGESPQIAKPWLETPIDFTKILTHTNKIVGIFSDNDPFVPLASNQDLLDKKLHAQTMVLHDKGHFTESDNVTTLPEAITAIEKILSSE